MEKANLIGANLARADLSGAKLSRAGLRADLSGADLSRADLSGADLSRADLSGADLSGANLGRADLSGAWLSEANLSGANLIEANLSGANLIRANLIEANLSEADLSGANLIGADLSRANLSRADLSGADLSRADLSGADLSGANLGRADLSRARLRGADLSRANLIDANLSGAWLSEANLSGANLIEANLSGANLIRANLREANLIDADLSGANLIGADLSRADLSKANLSRADLSKANLGRADLSGAKLSQANLSRAFLRANLSRANLREANLSSANLCGANLIDADLSGAKLIDADLSGADLSGAKLIDADLSGADLSGAKLRGVDEGTHFLKMHFTGRLPDFFGRLPHFFFCLARGWTRTRRGPVVAMRRLDHLEPPRKDIGWELRGECTMAMPKLPSENLAVRRIKAIGRRASLLLKRLFSRDWRLADPVDCTVFAPPSVAQGDRLLVQVFAHRPDQAEETRGLAQEIDEHARKRGFKSLEMGIERGTSLTFHLHVPGIKLAMSTQRLVWQGRPTYVEFAVQAPSEVPIGTVIGRVTVSRDNIPIGSIMFRLAIVEKNGAPRAPNTLLSDTIANRRGSLLPVGDRIRRYKKAFISYASKDRSEVLKRVQMLRLARIRYFQDVLKLEPGDRWERKLYRHIDRSDLFLLFWSTNAKESKWVLEEARYAIKRKGGNDLAPPDVIPVIIEGPPVPKPPEDLAHLHFNDYLIYFMIPPPATHQVEKP